VTVFAELAPDRVQRYNFMNMVLNLPVKWKKSLSQLQSASTNKSTRKMKRHYTIYLSLYSPCGPWPLFQFLNLYTVGKIPWTGDQPVARPLPAHRTAQTQNKRTQTSMPWVGFEPTIPVFERAKAVHVLDREATVIGMILHYRTNIYFRSNNRKLGAYDN
jgi:hypothetical protein